MCVTLSPHCKFHTLGLTLWRAGILIVGGYFLFLALRLILHITDPILEVGVTPAPSSS
jgi:hypothetical protein